MTNNNLQNPGKANTEAQMGSWSIPMHAGAGLQSLSSPAQLSGALGAPFSRLHLSLQYLHNMHAINTGAHGDEA